LGEVRGGLRFGWWVGQWSGSRTGRGAGAEAAAAAAAARGRWDLQEESGFSRQTPFFRLKLQESATASPVSFSSNAWTTPVEDHSTSRIVGSRLVCTSCFLSYENSNNSIPHLLLVDLKLKNNNDGR
jgi:hypothetical protein